MRTRFLISISLVLGVAAVGCSSNGSGSIANVAPPTQGALNAATGAKLWSYTTSNQVFSSPVVANGVVYVGSGDDKMYAFGL